MLCVLWEWGREEEDQKSYAGRWCRFSAVVWDGEGWRGGVEGRGWVWKRGGVDGVCV